MDQTLNLAFSMYNNPGVYALLLGSGISKSAGIPTGWEIKQQLITEYNQLSDEKLSEDISYSDLLSKLGKTPEERNMVIRRFFENDETSEQTINPSIAHQRIAALVKAGYIKVILTTNFDRLMERTLEEINFPADIIGSVDMSEGAVPIRHSKITIIKLHGDYRDVRTLNTGDELAQYDPKIEDHLRAIFDEYGLIVCGWSAVDDKALRDAIYRTTSHRFSSYWVEPYQLSISAQDVIHHRKAEVIRLTADNFFTDILAKVEALARVRREHPLTVEVAVAQIKKLIPQNESYIDLEEFVRKESERTISAVKSLNPTWNSQDNTQTQIQNLIEQYYAPAEITLSILVTICIFGKAPQVRLITDVLNRWAIPRENYTAQIYHNIPVLLAIYACSIAAIFKSNWEFVRATLVEPKIRTAKGRSTKQMILEEINKGEIFGYTNGIEDQRSDPYIAIISPILYPLFKEFLPEKIDYDELVDLSEFLIALLILRINGKWLPHNAGMRDYLAFNEKFEPIKSFWNEGGKQGNEWGLLSSLFDGNVEELVQALDKYLETANKKTWRANGDKFPNYREEYLRDNPLKSKIAFTIG